MSEMLQQVKEAKNAAVRTAQTGEGGNPNGTEIDVEDLPEGSAPLEASSEEITGEAPPAETSEEDSGGETPPKETRAAKKKIRIGHEEFDSEEEAFKYAETLQQQEIYNQGVRDTLAQTAAPQVETPPEDDKFEERFYSNPKEALREVQTKARDEAIAVMRAEQKKEQLWTQFLNENPDVRRKDAERILNENAQVFSKIDDIGKAMKLLAQKTRSEYEEIRALSLPKTELSGRRGPVSASSGGAPRVTPTKKEGPPLDFISQMKATFKR